LANDAICVLTCHSVQENGGERSCSTRQAETARRATISFYSFHCN
jgi:hypothetical protein